MGRQSTHIIYSRFILISCATLSPHISCSSLLNYGLVWCTANSPYLPDANGNAAARDRPHYLFKSESNFPHTFWYAVIFDLLLFSVIYWCAHCPQQIQQTSTHQLMQLTQNILNSIDERCDSRNIADEYRIATAGSWRIWIQNMHRLMCTGTGFGLWAVRIRCYTQYTRLNGVTKMEKHKKRFVYVFHFDFALIMKYNGMQWRQSR